MYYIMPHNLIKTGHSSRVAIFLEKMFLCGVNVLAEKCCLASYLDFLIIRQ